MWGRLLTSDPVYKDPTTQDDFAVLNMSNPEHTRSEVRQFLVALSALAFVLSTLGLRDGGPMAFAADIVLVLCGGWCANQLIRGLDVLKEQIICILQAYFTGLLCCSVVLFVIGWMVFLPSEFVHLGHSLLFAATFTTNLQLALLPSDVPLRFDGLLDHLWVPALIAQCCAILTALYWLMHRNVILLLTVLVAMFVGSLSVSTAGSPFVQMLPIGGLWAFLGGALPFLAANRFPVLRFSLLLGIVNLITGVLAAVATGDTLFARTFLALSFAFLYLGSRPKLSPASETKQRRRWFGMLLHIFLWVLPLAHVASALDMTNSGTQNYTALLVPSLLFAILSWSVWQSVERKVELSRITPTLVIACMLVVNAVTTLTSQGLQVRYTQAAQAYIHAIDTKRRDQKCPFIESGTLAGLEVCKFGPKGPPEVLIWGDHQLSDLQTGYKEAARKAGVSILLIAQANCIPLDGLQTRYAQAGEHSGRSCDQHSAQVLQAIPHLKSVKQVVIAADWLLYSGITVSAHKARAPVRLGPLDGTPIDVSQQTMYVSKAVENTVQHLMDQGLRVSVIRQVPAQPRFNAEYAARSNAPGAWLYQSMPPLKIDVSIEEATNRHSTVDDMFRKLSAAGRIKYIDSWPVFCSARACSARGGLSSDYVNETRLTTSGALALAPVLADDLKRVRTHTAYKLPPGG